MRVSDPKLTGYNLNVVPTKNKSLSSEKTTVVTTPILAEKDTDTSQIYWQNLRNHFCNWQGKLDQFYVFVQFLLENINYCEKNKKNFNYILSFFTNKNQMFFINKTWDVICTIRKNFDLFFNSLFFFINLHILNYLKKRVEILQNEDFSENIASKSYALDFEINETANKTKKKWNRQLEKLFEQVMLFRFNQKENTKYLADYGYSYSSNIYKNLSAIYTIHQMHRVSQEWQYNLSTPTLEKKNSRQQHQNCKAAKNFKNNLTSYKSFSSIDSLCKKENVKIEKPLHIAHWERFIKHPYYRSYATNCYHYQKGQKTPLATLKSVGTTNQEGFFIFTKELQKRRQKLQEEAIRIIKTIKFPRFENHAQFFNELAEELPKIEANEQMKYFFQKKLIELSKGIVNEKFDKLENELSKIGANEKIKHFFQENFFEGIANEKIIQELGRVWVEHQEAISQLTKQALQQALFIKQDAVNQFLHYRQIEYVVNIASTAIQFFLKGISTSLLGPLWKIDQSTAILFLKAFSSFTPYAPMFEATYILYPDISLKIETIFMLFTRHVFTKQFKPHEYSFKGYVLDFEIRSLKLIEKIKIIFNFFPSLIQSFFSYILQKWQGEKKPICIEKISALIEYIQSAFSTAFIFVVRQWQINSENVQDLQEMIQNKKEQIQKLCELDIQEMLAPDPIKTLDIPREVRDIEWNALHEYEKHLCAMKKRLQEEQLERPDPLEILAEAFVELDVKHCPKEILQFFKQNINLTIDKSSKAELKEYLYAIFKRNDEQWIETYKSERFSYLRE